MHLALPGTTRRRNDVPREPGHLAAVPGHGRGLRVLSYSSRIEEDEVRWSRAVPDAGARSLLDARSRITSLGFRTSDAATFLPDEAYQFVCVETIWMYLQRLCFPLFKIKFACLSKVVTRLDRSEK